MAGRARHGANAKVQTGLRPIYLTSHDNGSQLVNENIVIRDFVDRDSEAVNGVAVAAWAQYSSQFVEWDRLAAFLGSLSGLASQADLMVAECAGTVVGVVGYMSPFRPREAIFPGDWAIVRMLSVAPNMRGRGIGRMLTEACIERARRDRAPILALHTSPVMKSALNLYLRIGFTLKEHIPHRFGVPYAVYVLHMD